MRVRLMLTCLCDAFYGEVGISTVQILEHAGCRVEFDERQTCCGQPPFNAGDWDAARSVAQHALEVFKSDHDAYLVTPSSSCAAMLREGYPMLLPGNLPPRMFELSEFLMQVLGVDRWPLRGNRVSRPRKVVLHQACHGRVLGLGDTQAKLLGLITGLEVVLADQPEQCCGFGGAFSVSHPATSAGIGLEKLRTFQEAGGEEVVSGDMGCLMHLDGLIRRNGLNLRTRHIAELLAEVIDG